MLVSFERTDGGFKVQLDTTGFCSGERGADAEFQLIGSFLRNVGTVRDEGSFNSAVCGFAAGVGDAGVITRGVVVGREDLGFVVGGTGGHAGAAQHAGDGRDVRSSGNSDVAGRFEAESVHDSGLERGQVSRACGGAGVGGDASSRANDGRSESASVSEKTLVNRRRRHRRAEVKRSRKAEMEVPEWRRKSPSALVHKGVFSECSVEVQKELRESRARMLVAKNNTALAEAEHRRRTVEARMKARMVEEEVERHRLELAEVNRKLVEAQAARLPVGFAETVASFGLESLVSSPSLSSGSVSPDSSVSVAELKRREAAVMKLIERVTQLQVENEELKKKSGEKVEVSEAVKSVAEQALGRQRMPSVEREIRKVRGLPLVGPGSGLGGYSKWD